MIYRVIGLMSGSSLDGLDMALVEFNKIDDKWSFNLLSACMETFDSEIENRLRQAHEITAFEYCKLHRDFGFYCGKKVNEFVSASGFSANEILLVASHGHTVFHFPDDHRFTAQLGDGAALAATSGINVVSDLRALDLAYGGKGAPIVPLGESELFHGYHYFLNLGGIANLSCRDQHRYVAFDVCAANAVLNRLCNDVGMPFDEGGKLATAGKCNVQLLQTLNALEYYQRIPPKTLDNKAGRDEIYPLVKSFSLPVQEALHTYCVHIARQVAKAIMDRNGVAAPRKMLVTGGGAFNHFLIQQLQEAVFALGIEVVIPSADIVNYKEAIVMAYLGLMRYFHKPTVIQTVTGAARASSGGALWYVNNHHQ